MLQTHYKFRAVEKSMISFRAVSQPAIPKHSLPVGNLCSINQMLHIFLSMKLNQVVFKADYLPVSSGSPYLPKTLQVSDSVVGAKID